ncbi:hypothetical protein KAT36_00800 [Candidatus Pacearchaeota archaeon]|nr:hypothetical protein [Candidatus Pacearchaeota archaeon]
MSIGEQLQAMSDRIDHTYKSSFVSRTQKLLDNRVNETRTFLDASLTFQNGSAMWRQDLPIIDITKLRSLTNPLINPEIPVQSSEHAYDLFKKYYTNAQFSKKGAYQRGIDDLERYCKD